MSGKTTHSFFARAFPHRRLAQAKAGPVAPSFVLPDVLAAAVGLIALVEHFRARAAYSRAPLLGLVLPALFCAFSPNDRRRAGAWFRALWERLEAYSCGIGRPPWIAAFVFAVAPAWLLNLSNEKTLGATDTKPVIPTAVSLLTEGDWELGEYFQPGRRKLNLRDRDGQIALCFMAKPHGIYSAYPAGMVPFAVAVSGTSALAGADLDDGQVQRRLEKMTAALTAAFTVGLFFLTALRLAPPAAAWVSTALLAAASGVFTTAGMALWQHGGVLFWSMAILFVEFRRTTRPARWDLLFQGFACAQLMTCRLTSVAFLVPFGVWVFVRAPRRAFGLVGFAGLAYLPWALAYWRTYGTLFGPSTGSLSRGMWTADITGPLLGVLFSPGRGLLTYQSWALAVLALAFPAVRSRVATLGRPAAPAGWVAFCAAAIAFQVLLVSAWGEWWGGWSWGSRLVVDVVPLCALLCVRPIAALWSSRPGRLAVVSLALLGLMAHVPGAYLNAGRWNQTAKFPEDTWSWSRPPFLAWSPGP